MASSKKKADLSKYKTYTPLQLVLAKPAMYIGGMEPDEHKTWVFNETIKRMEQKNLTYTHGLFHIFIEILMNAIDRTKVDPSVKNIKVNVNLETGWIDVYNDGEGIPVAKKDGDELYVPETCFTVFATSENYNEDDDRIVSGTHGIGAKATVVFSKEFKLETADGSNQFKQTYKNNLGDKGKAKIKNTTKSYTHIKFLPDFRRFGVDGITKDLFLRIQKRVYDATMLTHSGVGIYFNGKKIGVKSLRDFASLYVGNDKVSGVKVIEEVEPKKGFVWKYCLCLSPNRTFTHVSFVNGMETPDGGTHVNYIINQIVKGLTETANKKNKGLNITENDIKSHCMLFLIATVRNPQFPNQIKEKLSTTAKNFGVKVDVSKEFLKKASGSSVGIIDAAVNLVQRLDTKKLSKTDGKMKRDIHVDKLEDANFAGLPSKSAECTLILTEGDSAKASVLSGINILGRDRYGIFPLRGKLLNVTDKSPTTVAKNKEIQDIKKILGLQQDATYENDIKGLRYGKVMIITDADVDGTHITGLIINFINHYWPALLKNNKFLVRMATPIIKATEKKRNGQVIEFYGQGDYERWREQYSDGDLDKHWRIKYYKGLGTSSKEEFQSYCRDPKLQKYIYESKKSSDSINLAFKKENASLRKDWLRSYDPNLTIDFSKTELTYTEFIDNDLKHFSTADNVRSIPSIIDGLKPSQRKILFAAFKRNLTQEIKVAQFAGYISEHTEYHHGEQSLMGAIIGMAQNYVGSNNINLLYPSGQFGARTDGGKKSAASPRYIFTRLADLTKLIFPEADMPLLDYIYDEGKKIEPVYYVPIIPMLLVNGATGIGTGFSTNIPNYNPKELIYKLALKMNADEQPEDMISYKKIKLKPWYRDFKGVIKEVKQKTGPNTYTTYGILEELPPNKIRITELPIRVWTDDYMEYLSKLKESGDLIKSIVKHNSDTDINVTIEFTKPINKLYRTRDEIIKALNLQNSILISNMCGYDSSNTIKKYSSPDDIIDEYYVVRLALYVQRRKYQLKELKKESKMLSERARFVTLVVEGKIEIRGKSKQNIESQLDANKFQRMGSNTNYDYLLTMNLWTLSKEKVEELLTKLRVVQQKFRELKEKTATDLWKEDLEALTESIAYKTLFPEETKEKKN